MTLQELSHATVANGLALTHEQASLLGAYASLLQKKNQVVNLISRKDEDHILDRHILHSLALAMPQVVGYEFPHDASVFDIGAGGGLPGIPLAIVRPDLRVVLCDSIAKKVAAISGFVEALELNNANAVIGRAEELAKFVGHRNRYDVIISRAVAPLDELVKWTRGLMKAGAVLLSLKGGDLAAEIARTRRMRYVREVSERVLDLTEYHEFASDEKKVVRVVT